ncbi:MAG: alpha-amylase family glycosyl hydrolase [Myxococcota bacterium]|nr:alpha-amylase family glycosyl hydrolase [Myxococcota bacterium]
MRQFILACLALIVTTDCTDVDLSMAHQSYVRDWRDEVIYQIVVDRFEDGDWNNNMNVDYRKEAAYHGGDWQGIIDRLDYIETLGVTALWISPVVRNVENDAGFASYHGYWTQDFGRVNRHFGDIAKLQQLVRACHERGIKVILDIVTNHVGQLFYYDINRNGQPDIVFFGGGGAPLGSQVDARGNQSSDLKRVSEWDPEFDFRGVQGFTSLGENGIAPIEWVEDPANNRTPTRPIEFANSAWYNRKGRTTIWEDECQRFRICHQNAQAYASNGAPESIDEPVIDPSDALFWCGDAPVNPYRNTCMRAAWDYLRQQEIEGDFPGGLKDLNTSRKDVQDALIRAFQAWIEIADFDGFRIDTLKHVEPEFFERFAPAIRQYAKALGKDNFFMFGEAFDGRDFLLGSYTHGEGVDSVFYFSAKYTIFNGVFGGESPTSSVADLYRQRSKLIPFGPGIVKTPCPADASTNDPAQTQCRPMYSDAPKKNGLVGGDGTPLNPRQLLVHFLDNHDVPRFLYEYPDKARFRNALTFLFTTDGVPCLYYGTEQDFAGGPDPSNREDMWVSGFSTEGVTFKWIQKLISLRKKHVALRRGDAPVFHMTERNAGILAFERTYTPADGRDGQSVLVVFNTHNSETRPTTIDGAGMTTQFPPNTMLTDSLTGQTFNTDDQGRLTVQVPANSAFILTGETP